MTYCNGLRKKIGSQTVKNTISVHSRSWQGLMLVRTTKEFKLPICFLFFNIIKICYFSLLQLQEWVCSCQYHSTTLSQTCFMRSYLFRADHGSFILVDLSALCSTNFTFLFYIYQAVQLKTSTSHCNRIVLSSTLA